MEISRYKRIADIGTSHSDSCSSLGVGVKQTGERGIEAREEDVQVHRDGNASGAWTATRRPTLLTGRRSGAQCPLSHSH